MESGLPKLRQAMQKEREDQRIELARIPGIPSFCFCFDSKEKTSSFPSGKKNVYQMRIVSLRRAAMTLSLYGERMV